MGRASDQVFQVTPSLLCQAWCDRTTSDPFPLLPGWQTVAQAKHAKDLDASANKLQSHHAELQENAGFVQSSLRHSDCFNPWTFKMQTTMCTAIEHCMEERLDHFTEAACACAVFFFLGLGEDLPFTGILEHGLNLPRLGGENKGGK